MQSFGVLGTRRLAAGVAAVAAAGATAACENSSSSAVGSIHVESIRSGAFKRLQAPLGSRLSEHVAAVAAAPQVASEAEALLSRALRRVDTSGCPERARISVSAADDGGVRVHFPLPKLGHTKATRDVSDVLGALLAVNRPLGASLSSPASRTWLGANSMRDAMSCATYSMLEEGPVLRTKVPVADGGGGDAAGTATLDVDFTSGAASLTLTTRGRLSWHACQRIAAAYEHAHTRPAAQRRSLRHCLDMMLAQELAAAQGVLGIQAACE